MLSKQIILNNGVKMPILGFGTYKLGNFDETKEAVKNDILSGYRHMNVYQLFQMVLYTKIDLILGLF